MYIINRDFIMIFYNLNILIAQVDSFSINTNVFETNIFNLAVVIGILVYYGYPFLTDLLKTRKDVILKSLQDADNKLREAEEILLIAKNNFETSKLKADQIRIQGNFLSKQTSESLLNGIGEDIKRLKSSNVSTILFEEEKSISEICHKLGSFALIRSIEILNERVNLNLQKKLIAQNTDKLSLKILFNK
jgi:F-type H+-transporting ATPase subunit b